MRPVLKILWCGALLLAGCPNPTCEESVLTYENFGEGHLLNYCTSCHSSELVGEEARSKAPPQFNFDTLTDTRLHTDAILGSSVYGDRMPPRNEPDLEETDRLGEWLECGAR